MSRSSIFSFETLDLRGNRWSRVISALALGLGLLVIAEAAARWLLTDVGRRWEYWHPEAAATWEAYHLRVSSGLRVGAVIVGDSTAHCDFDRSLLEQAVGPGAEVWNLAWDGNFADAFASSTLPLLDDGQAWPKLIVFSMTPAGFIKRPLRPSEAAILNCPYCRRARSGWLVEDRFYLARLWPAMPALLADWRGEARSQADARRGFAPKDGLLDAAAEASSRETSPASTAVLDERRIEVLVRLAVAAREHGSRLIVAVPPTKDAAAWRESAYAAYRTVIERASQELEFQLFDGMRESAYPREYFADRNHLNARGAREFTRRLAAAITADASSPSRRAATSPPSAAPTVAVAAARHSGG